MRNIKDKLRAGQWRIRAALVENASAAEQAQEKGADLIAVYHTTALKMNPIASLMPYGNPNEMVMEMLAQLSPSRLQIPTYVGVCGSEPLRRKADMLADMMRLNVAGVQNFPTIGIADGIFRYNMEAVQFGYKQEVALLHTAKELGLNVLPYVFNQSEALQMVFAGAESLIFHLGPAHRSLVENNLSQTVANYLERIRVFETVVRQNHPDIQILVHSPSRQIIRALEQPMRERTRVDGMFELMTLNNDGTC